jgi:hypothetical protein
VKAATLHKSDFVQQNAANTKTNRERFREFKEREIKRSGERERWRWRWRETERGRKTK